MPSLRDPVGFAPAKINLTLHVLGRRPDGYHELESLVAFADIGDRLSFVPGEVLALEVDGPTAAAAGETGDNLVLKAARALGQRVEGIRLGRFTLVKALPVAAGLGGGSSDAAAALRLIARANRLAFDDPRLHAAAMLTGADVPVCLDPRARIMRGIGEVLSAPLRLPALPAVLVNPRVALPTGEVFAALAAPPLAAATGPDDFVPAGVEAAALVALLSARRNDLEAPALKLQPVIGEVLAALRACAGCTLARMSGSGATCVALFDGTAASEAAARWLRGRHPGWWVAATMLK